jgi:uncharacterized protein DUF1844
MPERPYSDPAEQLEGAPDTLDELREQLAAVSAGDVIAQAALSLLTLAFIRLGLPPEQHEEFRDLEAARLLIDALGGMLDGAAGRLGMPERELREGLAQARMAYVSVASHAGGGHRPAPAQSPDAEPPADEPSARPSGLWVPGQD